MRNILLTLVLFSFWQVACASEIENVLGVTPGEVSKIKGTSTGGPFEIFRIPTKDSALSSIYPDLEVMISRDSKKIIGVGSKRAYFSTQMCKEAQDKVRVVLKKIFSESYEGHDPRWQYQSKALGITAGAVCENSLPYPVLRLDVTHTATNNEILKHFR